MKKMCKFPYFLAAGLLLVLADCSDDKEPQEPEEKPEQGAEKTYIGTLIVDQNDGTLYTQKNVSLIITVDDGEAVMELKEMSFSDRMPLKLDITMPGVTVRPEDGKSLLSGEGIVPLAMGGPFEQYTITGLTGELSEERIDFEMMCGAYPTLFTALHEDQLPVPEQTVYRGILYVDQNDGQGTVYVQQEVTALLAIDLDTDRADLLLEEVSFSDRMPFRLDMTIPGITVRPVYGGYAMEADGIVPLALGGEYEDYVITALTGSTSAWSDTGIEFEMYCGQYPTRFVGVKKE
ncbi:MAG: hypothetical protein LUD68_11185 [Rikenellaceae bacterium]|nr:hypothetical protein [Rikenellaceae bacterium]